MNIDSFELLFFWRGFGLLFRPFGFYDFLIIVGILVSLVILLLSLIYAFRSLIKRQEQASLMKEKVLPEIISGFGKVISIEASHLNRSIRFERHGTIFDLQVAPLADGDSSVDVTENILRFSLPNFSEKFYIQHKSFFSANRPSDCREVQAIMPDDFIFHSLNPEFLLDLLQKENIRGEIYRYQKKFSRRFSIAFENGSFTVIWHRGFYDNDDEITINKALYGESPQNEIKKIEQICRTAVVFHDELTKSR
jgi:hypothetical protein